MHAIIIGNIIALIASLLMVYSGVIKQKKKILFIQTIQIGLSVISNIVLGGIVGAIINTLSCIRNILCYKDKLNISWKILISIIAIVLSVKFNNLGLIGILPLISTITYLWLMNTRDVVRFKCLIIFTMVLWFVYDLTIKSYSSAVFDLMTAITNIYSIIMLNNRK
jgi:hypothetical protein